MHTPSQAAGAGSDHRPRNPDAAGCGRLAAAVSEQQATDVGVEVSEHDGAPAVLAQIGSVRGYAAGWRFHHRNTKAQNRTRPTASASPETEPVNDFETPTVTIY